MEGEGVVAVAVAAAEVEGVMVQALLVEPKFQMG